MFWKISVLPLVLLICACGSSYRFKKANRKWKKGDKIYFSNRKFNEVPADKANEAAVHFRKALRIYPRHASSENGLGLVFYQLKEYDSAMAHFNKAIEYDRKYSAAYNNRGMTWEKLKKTDMAESDYFKAIERDEKNKYAYYNLGILYADMRQYKKSITFYNDAIRLDPDYTIAYNNRGLSKARSGMFEEAILDYQKAISMDSLYKNAWNNMGLAKSKLNRHKEAIADFNTALKCKDAADSPTDTYTYNNMANTYFAMGDTGNACKNWQTAIDKGYKYKPEWKEIYQIDDPVELIKKHCR